jgi:uncharacterized protein (DUF924 family)
MMSANESTADAIEPAWVGDVIQFWFAELTEAHWFARNDDLDERIRDRFLALHEQIVLSDGIDAAAPRTVLAAVIVVDQFSRNMFRGTPRAFAADPIARRFARQAVERGFDLSMTREERLFLYLPFEHSEDREDQARSVHLIGQLGHEEWTRYAQAHRSIIDRFGRFPHRNAILGRTSTPDELGLLNEPMGSF